MSELPHVYATVVHMLSEAAEQAPQREALVCEAERLTYREYSRCVAGFAHELIGLGASGGRVGMVLGNSIDICVATFAIHAARAQAVPINPAYTERELRHIFQDADLHAIVYADDKRAVVEALADELGISRRIRIGADGRRLTEWRADEDIELPQPLPGAGDLATLQYTGGTTGRAKGVNLTHRAVASNISQREAILPTRKDQERLLCVMPLFHIYAVAMCLHNMVYARGTLVILPRYTVEAVFDIVRRERVTIFAGSPTLFVGLLAHPGFAQADFSSLSLTYSGSAALPEELLRRWQAATGAPVLEGYGQSETGPVLSFNPLHGERKFASVGLPLPETEIEIVDLEQGTRVLAVGEKGEIRVRGPQLMSGYRNLPKETAETLRDGYVYTGDIGEFDADGYLFIRDRKKEMAKVSGFNVFPREIEEVLYQHPSVREAAVVAVPDAYRGEVVKAFVVPNAEGSVTAEQLAAHCQANLAKYKWPVAINLVSELPKTGVGKIDKNRLRTAQAATPPQAREDNALKMQNEDSNSMKRDLSPQLLVPQPRATSTREKAVKLGLSIIPWLIIAALLWVGLFIKPQPVGTTVQPPSIERTDSFYGIASPAKGVLWVVGNKGKVVRSEDDGLNWVLQATPTHQHLQDIASWDAKRAVAVGNNGVVIVSADGGTTWSEVQAPVSAVSNKLLRVKALPEGRAWAVGEMGALLESLDYGHTWQRRLDEVDAAWNDVFFLDAANGWLVGEAGRMMRTGDGGKNWKLVNGPVKISLTAVAFRDVANGVAVGLEGSLLATHDGGNTWQLLPRAKRIAAALATGDAANPAAVKQRVPEEAGEHLFDIAWDEAQQIWLAVGNQGVWVQGDKNAVAWEAGRVDARNLAWHTRVIVANDQTYMAGASVGAWNKRVWRAFKSKG